MHGNNEIQMCQSEMVAAMDYYLRNVVFQKDYADKVKVQAVNAREEIHFTIKLGELQEGEK